MSEKTLALAGLFQATELVRQAATHGTWSGYAAITSLDSLLKVDSDSVQDIFGDRKRLLIGVETLVAVLQGENRYMESLRYSIGLLQLERKFRKQSAMQAQVGQRLEELARRRGENPEQYTEDLLANDVAELYSQTISNLSPRIVVHGNPRYLQTERTVSWIRALLFAGLRSAVLWDQLGGNRWNLMFGRRQMLEDAQNLLQG